MPATATKPFNLKPAEAHAAAAAAPALVAKTAAQAPTTAAASVSAAAASAARLTWAPLSAIAGDDQAMAQALDAGGARRITTIYERKQESVTTMETIENENRQALTLLPGSGTVAI
jgi:predicted deacylase